MPSSGTSDRSLARAGQAREGACIRAVVVQPCQYGACMTEGGAAEHRGRLARVVDAHLGSRDVARVIYGAIIGLALVVALQVHPPSAGQAAAAVIGTAVAVGLAEAYSELVGVEVRTRRRLRAAQVRATLAEGGAVAFGAGFPALFFLLASVGAIDLQLAFNLSKWSGLALLCAYGF